MTISLKAARVNAELTRPDVLARLKNEHGIVLSLNTLANYENKVSQPDINTGKALASIYGLTVNDIIFLGSDCALSTKRKLTRQKISSRTSK